MGLTVNIRSTRGRNQPPKEWLKKIQGMVKPVPIAEAGFPAGATYPNGISVAYVAYIQNKGIGGVPERPFMQRAVDENSKKWTSLVAAQLKGKSSQPRALFNAFRVVSKEMEADIVDTIKKWPWEEPRPNAPATIRRKQAKAQSGGNAVPTDPNRALIDTAVMVGAVSSNVKEV